MSVLGEKLIEAVRHAAEERPTLVYQKPKTQDGDDLSSCVYVHDGKPSCIIGQAAWDLGLIDAAFEWRESNSGGVEGFAKALDLDLDEDEQLWLESTQNNQDIGIPWADAVGDADARADWKV